MCITNSKVTRPTLLQLATTVLDLEEVMGEVTGEVLEEEVLEEEVLEALEEQAWVSERGCSEDCFLARPLREALVEDMITTEVIVMEVMVTEVLVMEVMVGISGEEILEEGISGEASEAHDGIDSGLVLHACQAPKDATNSLDLYLYLL
jgi:hypothetical protein